MPLDCAAFVHICAAAAFEYLASVLVHGLSFQFIPINHWIQFTVQILYKIPQTMFTEVSSAFHSQLLLHFSSRQTNKKETTEHLFHYSARTWNVVFIFIFPSYLEKQNQLLHCWHAQNDQGRMREQGSLRISKTHFCGRFSNQKVNWQKFIIT